MVNHSHDVTNRERPRYVCSVVVREPYEEDYKCPPCGSGKNAFRPEKKMDYKKDGFNAPGIRQAKKANKAAFEAKRAAARKKAEMEAKKRK